MRWRATFQRPDNGFYTTWFLSQRVLPPVVVVIPFFLIMRQLHLLDTVWSLVLLNATFTLPFPGDHSEPDVSRAAD